MLRWRQCNGTTTDVSFSWKYALWTSFHHIGGGEEQKKHASNYPEMEGWQIKSWPSAGCLECRARSSPHIFKRNAVVSLAIPQLCQECPPSLLCMTAWWPSCVWPVYFIATAFTSGVLYLKGKNAEVVCHSLLQWMERPWCWERLRAGGEVGNRGWDGWMASLTQWT